MGGCRGLTVKYCRNASVTLEGSFAGGRGEDWWKTLLNRPLGRCDFVNNVVTEMFLASSFEYNRFDYNACFDNTHWRYATCLGKQVKNSVDTDSLDEYRQKTGFEEHGFEVPREQGSIQADKPLSAESPLIDKGCILPNVNDDFTGKAPDIGPYEYGKPLPHYGPRTEMHD